MKQRKTILFLLALLLASFPTIVSANITVDSLTYSVIGKTDSVSLVNGRSASGDFVMPDTINYNGKNYIVVSIGDGAFFNCMRMTSIVIPCTIKRIGIYAFAWSESLLSVTIPNSVTEIAANAFSGCHKLHAVTLSDKLTTIDDYTFEDCSMLTSVTIPNSVKRIGTGAFASCSIDTLRIPSSVRLIEGRNYGRLKYISVDKGNKNYVDVNGVLYTINKDILVSYPNDRADTMYKIPSTVVSILPYAFMESRILTSVSIPNSVAYIGQNAFGDCTKLKSIILPTSLRIIESSTFSNCNSLDSIFLPNSITSIKTNAFAYCRNLTSITIPSSVTQMGNEVFYGCNKLKSIKMDCQYPPYGSSIYPNCASEIILYVPHGTVSRYASSSGWNEFPDIVDDSHIYTLSTSPNGANAYSYLHDLIGSLASTEISSSIIVKVELHKQFSETLDSILSSKLTSIQQQLNARGCHLIFMNDSVSDKTILNFVTTPNSPYLLSFLGFTNMKLLNVSTSVSGMRINVDALSTVKSQISCTNHETSIVDFSSISPDASFSWQLKHKGSVKGLVESGTGYLPVMTLMTDSNKCDTVIYEVMMNANTTAGLVPMFNYDYRLFLNPQLSGTFNTSIKDSTIVQNAYCALTWSPIKNAVYYSVYLWKEGNSRPDYSYRTTNDTLCNMNLSYAEKYHYQVVANGRCEDMASDTISFSVREVPDLIVKDIVVADTLKAYTRSTICAVIKNVGKGSTVGKKYCSIYMSSDGDMNNLQYLDGQTMKEQLAPNDSMIVKIDFLVPDDSLKSVCFVVNVNGEEEDSISNNYCISQWVTLVGRYVQTSDYAVLKKFYTVTNGKEWSDWDINSSKISERNWSGVNFDDDGFVTEIYLYSKGLKGSLPGDWFALKHLKTLCLSDNQLTGDVSPFVKNCDSLRTLRLAENRISSVSSPLNDSITNLDLHGQSVHLNPLPQISLCRTHYTSIPTVMTYNHAKHSYIYPESLYFTDSTRYRRIVYIHNEGGDLYSVENLSSGVKLNSADMLYLSDEYGSSYPVKLTYVMGDATVDSLVNISDVQSTLNYALWDSNNSMNVFNFCAADTYPDDKLNVQDVVTTVNLVLANHDTLSVNGGSSQVVAAKSFDGSLATNLIYVKGNKLMLDSSTPVAVADITLTDVSLSQLRLLLPQNKYQLYGLNTESGVRFIILSTSGNEIPLGPTAIADWTSRSASISAVSMVDKSAAAIPVTISGTSTNINDVGSSDISITASKRLVVITLAGTKGKLHADVYDNSGKMVASSVWKLVADGGSRSIQLNADGMYFIKVTVSDGTKIINKQVKLIIAE